MVFHLEKDSGREGSGGVGAGDRFPRGPGMGFWEPAGDGPGSHVDLLGKGH